MRPCHTRPARHQTFDADLLWCSADGRRCAFIRFRRVAAVAFSFCAVCGMSSSHATRLHVQVGGCRSIRVALGKEF